MRIFHPTLSIQRVRDALFGKTAVRLYQVALLPLLLLLLLLLLGSSLGRLWCHYG